MMSLLSTLTTWDFSLKGACILTREPFSALIGLIQIGWENWAGVGAIEFWKFMRTASSGWIIK